MIHYDWFRIKLKQILGSSKIVGFGGFLSSDWKDKKFF